MAIELSATVLRRLTKELVDLQSSPCEGIRVQLNEHELTDVQAEIDGPTGTPFEGGLFRIKLVLPSEFPAAPPKGYFLTKIFHPNISTSGDICVNVLRKDWTPDVGLRHVLMVVRCLLIEPFPESALNEEAGRLLLSNYEEYARHARLMTSIHAQPPKRPTPLTASGANAGAAPGDARDDSDSPLKKARQEQKPAAAVSKVKKNLRRL